MKKAILTAITSGLFVLALVFSMNTNTSEVTFGEEAFANGTCCTEGGSFCIVDGLVITDAFYKSSGSCLTIQQE